MIRTTFYVPKLVKSLAVRDISKFLRISHGREGRFYATKLEPKKLSWDQTISEGERLVGHPSSFLSLRWLLSDEMTNVTFHLRKLLESSHPSLQIAKNLLYNWKNSMQSWGLVILLLSKAAGFSSSIPVEKQDREYGILYSQRSLVDVTEMIRIASAIHRKSMVNLQLSSKDEVNEMIFGNIIGLLTGDCLLCHSCLELSKLMNSKVTGLISSAVSDFVESEFAGIRDYQNNAFPYEPSNNISRTLSDLDDDHFETDFSKPLLFHKYIGIPEKEWEARHMLSVGSLLAKGCQASLILAEHNEKLEKYGYLLGKHLALAWQASIDIETFFPYQLEKNSTFSLVGAPMLFHLNYDPSTYHEFIKGKKLVEEIDFKRLYQKIKNGPGLEMTKNLQLKHTTKALNVLEQFPPSEARDALENIITALQVL